MQFQSEANLAIASPFASGTIEPDPLVEVYARLRQIGRRAIEASHSQGTREPPTDSFPGRTGEGLELDNSAKPSARGHRNRGGARQDSGT